MRRSILPILLLTLLATFGAQPTFATSATDTPFSLDGGFVVVEARIKGDVPVHVVIATGAEYSIVDAALMQKYELPAYYAPEGPVNGVNDKTYTFTKVSSVRINDSKAKDLDMRLGSLSYVSKAAGREVFAALGADFFEGQTVQFDFKNKVLRFLDKAAVDALKDKTGASGGSNKIVLQMAEKASNPFLKTFRIPLVTDVAFDGQKTKLLLDTGRVTHVAISSSLAKNVGLTAPGETDPPREEKVKLLRLGTYEMSSVPVMLYGKGSNAEKSINKYGAVAGSVFLQNFVATFDFRSGLIVLTSL
jgi:hypothetical protein